MNTDIATILESTSFQPANKLKKKERMILNIQGLPDTGKTHMLLACPEPICIFDFDHNLEGILEKFPDKDIWVSEYDFDKPTKHASEVQLLKRADVLWNRFITEYNQALLQAKTIGIDSAGLMWELLRMARFGKMTSIMPHMYGPLNTEHQQIVDSAKRSNCNLVFLSTMQPEYIADQPSGRYVRQGWSRLDYHCSYSIELGRAKKKPTDKQAVFEGTIKKFKPDPNMVGQVLINPTFNDIFLKAFPKGV